MPSQGTSLGSVRTSANAHGLPAARREMSALFGVPVRQRSSARQCSPPPPTSIPGATAAGHPDGMVSVHGRQRRSARPILLASNALSCCGPCAVLPMSVPLVARFSSPGSGKFGRQRTWQGTKGGPTGSPVCRCVLTRGMRRSIPTRQRGPALFSRREWPTRSPSGCCPRTRDPLSGC